MTRTYLVAVVVGLLSTANGSSAVYASEGAIEAITQPSEQVVLSFVRAGKVAEVLVKPGDAVKAGDLLVRLDDRAERAQLAQLAAQASNDVRVRAAKAQLDQKKVDYEALVALAKQNSASKQEVDHAALDVTIAELSLELSRFQQAQDKLKLKEVTEQIERMRLLSPIVGEVHEVVVEPGEAVDALEDVVRLINTAKLRIDVPVPVDLGRKLLGEWEQARAKKQPFGRTACVYFPLARQAGEKAAKICTGEIIFISKEADAASDTLLVRVEVDRPAGHPAGEHVRVTFPDFDPTSVSRAAG